MSADHPSRRALLGAAAGSLALGLPGASARATPTPVASTDTPRVRAGGRVVVRCPSAVAFTVDAPGIATQRLPTDDGEARFRVPAFERAEEWTPLTCTPILAHGLLGQPVTVQVLTAQLRFGC